MLDLFKLEMEAQAAALGTGLLSLEAGAAAEAIEPLMRAAHSIKGAARILQFEPLVRLSHVMEDVFVAAQQDRVRLSPAHVDVLLAAADHFAAVAVQAEEAIPGWVEAHAGPLAASTAAVATLLGTGVPPAPEPEAAPPTAPAPPPEPAGPAEAVPGPEGDQAGHRVLRVSADNLSRLIGLAGTVMVDARQLAPLTDRFHALRLVHRRLLADLDRWIAEVPEATAAGTGQRLRETVRRVRESLADHTLALEQASRRLDDNAERLFRAALASRMRPFEDGVVDLPRQVRDLARQLGKEVRLVISGRDTRVDRDILEKLKAPLTHLVRNSLDHGIESPEARRAAGKPAQALLTVAASHRAGMLSVSVSDDGRGIDPEAVRTRVVQRGLADAEDAAGLSVAELHDFLFVPGFSTAAQVTDLSGRGVGLDVVRSIVQEASGSVRVQSTPGRGTTMALQLPVTLSVMRALIVGVAGEACAFPLARLDRVLVVPASEVRTLGGRAYVEHDGERLGLVPAAELLGMPVASVPAELAVVAVSDGEARYGIVVDRLVGEREIVVHTLDQRLGKLRNIAAASVLEDGEPLLIFDVDDLVRSADARFAEGADATAGGQGAGAGRRRALVVDDSVTVREMERRILEGRGWEVDVAVNGMDGWNRVRAGRYDVVVTDVDMPRMNGLQLTARIKGDSRLRRIPVLVVSYKERPEDRNRGLAAGADHYLSKSELREETLLAAVERVAGGA